MKKNTIMALKKIIKETVEKEVARQMQIVIKEITSPQATQHSKPAKTQAPAQPISVKDPVLNQILAETQGGIPAEQAPYPTMGGGAYTTQHTNQLGGGINMQPTDPNMPDFMKKAMSGHSAKVVKAIENKHGTKS
tara:strand:+ start:1090 stop:1494 length:405 start_codon:yes stop_codon:yes gene_type:complete